MTAIPAKTVELVSHGRVSRRELFYAFIQSDNSINSTRDGARIIAIWGKPDAALLSDTAAIGIIRIPIERRIHRGQVEGVEERRHSCVFAGIDNFDAGGNPGQDALNLGTTSVGPYLNSGLRSEAFFVSQQNRNDFEKLRMQRRLSPQQADNFPFHLFPDAFSDEFLDLLKAHPFHRPGLVDAQRPVAVVTRQVTSVGDINLDLIAVRRVRITKPPHNGFLAPDKKIKVVSKMVGMFEII